MAILCGKHNLDKFTHLIQTDRPLALVGGGACDAADLALAKRRSSCFVAADGGADTLLAHDITAEAVIGDLDSITVQARSQMPPDRLHLVAEQNSTDFEKCLRHISAPLDLGSGFYWWANRSSDGGISRSAAVLSPALHAAGLGRCGVSCPAGDVA